MSITSIILFLMQSMSNNIILRRKPKKREEELPLNQRLDRAISKFNALLNEATDRVSVKDLITMAEVADPSKIVPLGGFLFYHYLMNNATVDDRRLLKSLVRETRETLTTIPFSKFEPVYNKYKNKFYLHYLQHLSGAGARFQRYFLSFLFEFKGVNRSGLDVMGSFGIGLPLTSYDRYRKEAINKAEEKISNLVKSPHVLWLDNYSKTYYMHLFQVDKMGLKDSNWCAEGISPFTNNSESLTLDIPPGGMDGCPSEEQLFEQFEIVAEFLNFYVDEMKPDIFESSEVTTQNICTIPISFTKPLKQLLETFEDAEEAKRKFQEQLDKVTYMESFIPKSILKINIGSNLGIVNYLARLQYRMLHQEYKGKFVVLKCDCNIFLRIIGAIFSEGKQLDSLRSQLIPVLGTWHPFKVATERVFENYLHVFWVPALHAISPVLRVSKGQSLRKLTAFFTQCRLAFPTFKDRLQKMFAASNDTTNVGIPDKYRVPPQMKAHLQNLYYLFNFFIPTLHNYGLQLKNRSKGAGSKFLDKHLNRLLKLFLCLKSPLYEASLILNFAILNFLRSTGHPVWQMFNDDLVAFNEEPGELSFSLLQRFQRKDTMFFNFNHINEKYKLISSFYSCAKDFSNDLMKGGFADYFTLITIDPDSEEVQRLSNHFNKVLDQMNQGTWQYYRATRNGRKRIQTEEEKKFHNETSSVRTTKKGAELFGSKQEEEGLAIDPESTEVHFKQNCRDLFEHRVARFKASYFRAYILSEATVKLFEKVDQEEKRDEEEEEVYEEPPRPYSLSREEMERKYDDDDGPEFEIMGTSNDAMPDLRSEGLSLTNSQMVSSRNDLSNESFSSNEGSSRVPPSNLFPSSFLSSSVPLSNDRYVEANLSLSSSSSVSSLSASAPFSYFSAAANVEANHGDFGMLCKAQVKRRHNALIGQSQENASQPEKPAKKARQPKPKTNAKKTGTNKKGGRKRKSASENSVVERTGESLEEKKSFELSNETILEDEEKNEAGGDDTDEDNDDDEEWDDASNSAPLILDPNQSSSSTSEGTLSRTLRRRNDFNYNLNYVRFYRPDGTMYYLDQDGEYITDDYPLR